MTKRITIILLITMISSFAVGCGNETTTPYIITTTEEPTTTQTEHGNQVGDLCYGYDLEIVGLQS